MDKTSIGVIYTGIGEKFIDEALLSVKSLKKQHPNLKTTLFTNNKKNIKCFDAISIIQRPQLNYSDRIRAIIKCEYEYVLALDTDTYICGDIFPMFELLDEYEFAAAHAPIRKAPKIEGSHGGYDINGVPDSFPEVNGGVLLFKKNKRTLSFLEYWLKMYDEVIKKYDQTKSDQPVLRKALYSCNINHTILSPEYNCRYTMPSYVQGKVKILHGRNPNPENFEKKVNANLGPRIIIPALGIINENNFSVKLFKKIRYILKNV